MIRKSGEEKYQHQGRTGCGVRNDDRSPSLVICCHLANGSMALQCFMFAEFNPMGNDKRDFRNVGIPGGQFPKSRLIRPWPECRCLLRTRRKCSYTKTGYTGERIDVHVDRIPVRSL